MIAQIELRSAVKDLATGTQTLLIRATYHDLPVVLSAGYSHVLAQNGTYGSELLHKPNPVEQRSRLLRKVAIRKPRQRILGPQFPMVG